MTNNEFELTATQSRMKGKERGYKESTFLNLAGREVLVDFRITDQGSIEARAMGQMVISSSVHRAFEMLTNRIASVRTV